MNNKGQVLVIFVLLLPLLFLMAAYIVDQSYILYQSNKLNSINESVIQSIIQKPEMTIEEIKELYQKNDNNIIVLEIDLEPNIEVIIQKEIDSIFGQIIGKDKYKIKSIKTGTYVL